MFKKNYSPLYRRTKFVEVINNVVKFSFSAVNYKLCLPIKYEIPLFVIFVYLNEGNASSSLLNPNKHYFGH